jgi:hypothetical protein
MNTFIKLSGAVYRWILLLYPPDVRRTFGDEMADTFAQQLADAWEENRLASVIQVWWLALLELPAIALPRQLRRPALFIPVASLLSTTTIFVSLVWALEHSLVLSAWYHGMFGGGRH